MVTALAERLLNLAHALCALASASPWAAFPGVAGAALSRPRDYLA